MKKLSLVLLLTLLVWAPSAFAQLSIQSNGKEIQNNDVVRYYATEDIFGDMVAGHDQEPVFTTSVPCELEVTLTIPEDAANRFSWCGITHTCETLAEAGKHTRVNPHFENEDAMELHATFAAGAYATYAVGVEVKVDGKLERTFVLEYIYSEEVSGVESPQDIDDEVIFRAKAAHYRFATSASRTLQIFSGEGKTLFRTSIAGSHGTVSLGSLPAGSYLFRVAAAGQTIQSGKVLVK